MPGNYESVLEIVRLWPIPQRAALVRAVLASFVQSHDVSGQARPTLIHARGLLATDHPAPSDAEIETMLEQRRRERYEQ